MTNDVRDRLLPCPFCGGAADYETVHYDDGHGKGFDLDHIACSVCGCQTHTYDYGWDGGPINEVMIAEWNRRPERQGSKAAEKRVDKAAEIIGTLMKIAEKDKPASGLGGRLCGFCAKWPLGCKSTDECLGRFRKWLEAGLRGDE
jgi:hypothetical protein